MSNGLTPQGFVTKRLDEILEEINQETRVVFGESTNTSSATPLGQLNGVNAASRADIWEAMSVVYNACDPSTAQTVALSRTVELNGIIRKIATQSTVTCTFTGNAGTIIPVNFEVGVINTTDIFITTIQNTIGVGGTIDINMLSKEYGVIIAEVGTLNQIITPLNGLTSVTNVTNADAGSLEESDTQLRNRQTVSTESPSQNLIDSLYGQLNKLANIKSVNIFDSSDTDIGLPSCSFSVIILGASDVDIANTIFVGKPPGVITVGTTTVRIIDEQGMPRDINFSRPDPVDIYVTVNTTNTGAFPINGVGAIKQAIIDYAEIEFVVGNNVERTRLYTPINSIVGHSVQTLFIGTSPNPTGTIDIPITFSQLSRFTNANIEVNVA